MSNIQPRRVSPLARAARKFSVSGFVVASFAAYALHEHFGAPAQSAIATPLPLAATQRPAPAQSAATLPTSAPPRATAAPATAQPVPTDAPAPTAAPAAQGLYRDGSYSGPVTDAYYGNMQVQAVIQSGKLADVQILEFPNDRRTSIRINNIALPYLVSEAIQAQSANIDAISGATLSSEAFAQSLQSALTAAKGKL